MGKHFHALAVFFVLVSAALACASPTLPSSETAVSPASPDPNEVGTAVAMTLTSSVAHLLPHSFYYLTSDSVGHLQVFRIESDGITRRQITFETDSISDYDVSLIDGSVAYVANNQLLYVKADGSKRHVLVDGGAVDPDYPFLTTISSPAFSPDGQTLAYGYKGVQIYTFSTDTSQMIIENHVELSDGRWVPHELYSPASYSPDGKTLLIELALYEAAVAMIYYPEKNALVEPDGIMFCCDETKWTLDSSSIYAARPFMHRSAFSGLWRLDNVTDAETPKVRKLIDYLDPATEGNYYYYNAADEAYLAPDGQLYFFFITFYNFQQISNLQRSPLQLVRSAPDGVINRTVLSERTFELLNEALWAPDASFVIVALASAPEIYQGGQAEIIYLDGRPSVVLTPFARQMKWGP